MASELLRGDVSFKKPFKLLFKRLRCNDNKNKDFSDKDGGKFWLFINLQNYKTQITL